jgi:hypothetical protein
MGRLLIFNIVEVYDTCGKVRIINRCLARLTAKSDGYAHFYCNSVETPIACPEPNAVEQGGCQQVTIDISNAPAEEAAFFYECLHFRVRRNNQLGQRVKIHQ